LEGGIQEIDLAVRSGKWKVSRTCVCYLEERRLYHRKDGEIVKLRDDTLSAARYGYMMRRFVKSWAECDPMESNNPGWPSGGGSGGRGRSPAPPPATRRTARSILGWDAAQGNEWAAENFEDGADLQASGRHPGGETPR
jgi:hypothetical protein